MSLVYESGFLGSIEWITNSDPTNLLIAPEWSASITSWRLRYSQKMIDTTVIGQTLPIQSGHQARIPGVSSWEADVGFLMPFPWDGSSVQFPFVNSSSRTSYDLQRVEVRLFHTPGEGYEAVAYMGDIETDCPPDGPVTCRAHLYGHDPNVGLHVYNGNTVFPDLT